MRQCFDNFLLVLWKPYSWNLIKIPYLKTLLVKLLTIEQYHPYFYPPQWHNNTFTYYSVKAKKNKSYVSKLPRAFVFWCAFDSAKSKVWNFFACLIFFFTFLYELSCQNIQEKIWQTQWNTLNNRLQTSSTLYSVLYLAHPKIKFHISKLWPTQIWHVCCSGKKKKKKTFKKTAFRSGLPICHELWDIAFIFFSLMNKNYFIWKKKKYIWLLDKSDEHDVSIYPSEFWT